LPKIPANVFRKFFIVSSGSSCRSFITASALGGGPAAWPPGDPPMEALSGCGGRGGGGPTGGCCGSAGLGRELNKMK